MHASVVSHIANERQGQTGGVDEAQLHLASGLRCSPMSLDLQSDDMEVVQQFLVPDAAVQLGELDAAGNNISLIAGGTYGGSVIANATIKNNGILSWPSTVCLTYLASLALLTARTITWRIKGTDPLGNRLEEVIAFTLPNALTLHASPSSLYAFRSWTSHVYASIDSIELAKPDTTGVLDNVRIGTCYKWDVADEHVALYTDGTGGTFTVTVTINGASDTTGAIAFNATAAVLRAALVALAPGGVALTDVQVTKDTLVFPAPAGGWNNHWVIKFRDPVLGKAAVTVDDTLTTGNSGTVIVSGEDYANRDGCAVASPLELLSAGPPGSGGNLYPEILACTVEVPDLATKFATHAIASTTAGTDTVTLATPHGIAPTDTFLVVLNNVTGLTPVVNLVCIGTAVDDHSFTVNVDINGVGAVGTATIVGSVGQFAGAPHSSAVIARDAAGTRATPTGPGFRAGISDAGTAGGANKLQLYLNGNEDMKLALRDGRRLRLNHQNTQRYGPRHRLMFWVRTTKSTGRMSSDVSTYPR